MARSIASQQAGLSRIVSSVLSVSSV
ncbi:unnamed protein product, partial [uncultured bacterium]